MAKSSFLKRLTGVKDDINPKKAKTKKDKPTPKKKLKPKKKFKSKKISPKPVGEGQLGIDLYQTDNELILRATIAGVKSEDIDINISSESVTIRGKRQSKEEIKGSNFFYQECYWGSFSRSVLLPTEINADNSEAELKEGILTIKMPKLSKSQGKKLKIKI